MLKKLTLSAFACFIGLTSFAQAKIQDVVTSDYNRQSISLVVIERGDSYDSATANAVRSFSPSEKYDINPISTKSIKVNKLRSESVSSEETGAAVAKVGFAREILASIFNRTSDGMMDDKTVRFRGNYDAKDQDVINARAARVGEDALGDLGQKLIAGSYIVATDFYKVERSTDKKGKVYWSVNARAFAYKIGLGENGLNDFYEKCWIYEDDDAATRDAKIRAFQALDIPMNLVATSSNSATSSSVESAAYDCLSGLITGLENVIPEWEVAVTIMARKPLRAKIGTKEGLSNGNRYRAYSYTEDDNGNLKSVPRGFLRATEVANNSGMSIGETEPSEFYQVSGLANIEEGWTIKQSNDLGLGVAPGVRFGNPGTWLIGVDLDWLMDVKTSGSMQYILASFGIDIAKANYTPIYMELGYGYALHLTRLLELMPYIAVGLDHIGFSSSSTSESRFVRESALMLEPGVRVAANVAYPLQVYGKVFYGLMALQGELYERYNAYVGHKSGLGFQAGLKWTF